MSNRQQVESLVVALVQAMRASEEGQVDRVEVHAQDSGEYPYRIFTREDEYPLIGLAYDDSLPDLGETSTAAEPKPPTESQ